MAKVSVIIPAAGAGKRFAAKGNKIFQRIGDQPVFIRTLEAFTMRDDVCQIQLVVSADDMDPPALGAPGPFAWADPTVFGPILKEAGFSGLEWREAPVLLQVGETGEADPVTRAVAMLTRIGPAARRLKGQPEDVREALAERLAPALERYVEDGWVRMPGLVWVVRARA